MKWIAAIAGLVAVAIFGTMLGGRLSADALGMAVGILFGILAGIPAALLVLASRHQEQEFRRSQPIMPPSEPPLQIWVTDNPRKGLDDANKMLINVPQREWIE